MEPERASRAVSIRAPWAMVRLRLGGRLNVSGQCGVCSRV
jgi:hypothetical protein